MQYGAVELHQKIRKDYTELKNHMKMTTKGLTQ